MWFGVLFIHQGLYEGGAFRFTLRIPESYPDCSCPVSRTSLNKCSGSPSFIQFMNFCVRFRVLPLSLQYFIQSFTQTLVILTSLVDSPNGGEAVTCLLHIRLSSMTYILLCHVRIGVFNSFFRRNVNHIWQVLLYARRVFYKIDTKLPLNEDAAELWVSIDLTGLVNFQSCHNQS